MKVRLRNLVMAGLAAGTLGLGLAAPNAFASAQHPAAATAHHAPGRFNPGDNFELWPSSTDTPAYGIVTEGVNVQVQTASSGYTVWNTTAATTGYKIMPNGNSGHCLEQDSNELKIQNCMSGNNQQEWNFSTDGGGNTNIQNVNSGEYIGVFNPNASKPVWVEGKDTGYYTGWSLIPS